MSVESNRNIFIGSVVQSLNKRLITGSVNPEPIALLNLLIESVEYAMAQYNVADTIYNEDPTEENLAIFNKYKTQIQNLNKKIQDLKYKCPDICIYKDRVIIVRNYNTPPTIEDNYIMLPVSNIQQALNMSDVIYNYQDAENDTISKVVIIGNDSNNTLLVDNAPVIINNMYQPNLTMSIKYEDGTNNIYISYYDAGDCSIMSINEDDLEDVEGVVVTLDDNGQAVFNQIDNNTEEIPNDTIVYAHVDTSSMKAVDQDLLKAILLDWWEGFRTANPDFNGSFLISTVRNDEIPGSNYAPGRGSNNYVAITGSNLWTPLNAQEDWLKTPTQALLRQAYKEGLSNMTESEFLSYIEGKSLVVLSFIDESNGNYHGGNAAQGFTSNDIIQPTPYYITDYSGFLFKVRPRLGFFKGVQYPLVRTTGVVSSFLLHSLAAIEATILNPTQIDNLVGPDVVDAFGPTLMNSYFYSHLGAGNPYSFLNGLKDAGWEANFTKLTSNNAGEPTEAFTSGEFASELNDILTSTGDVVITTLDINTIPSANLGELVETEFELKVRDNNPIQPLWSNNATITVGFYPVCDNSPGCTGAFAKSVAHKQDYTFLREDFTIETNVNKVRLTNISSVNPVDIRWYNLPISNGILPIAIPMSDIINGNLKFISNPLNQDEEDIQLTFCLSYQNSYNYSPSCYFTLTKEANPNTPATIVAANQNLVNNNCPDAMTSQIVPTITYTGTGGYNSYWSKVSGPTGNNMVNPLAQTLDLINLVEGVYLFKLTVITNEDFFITEHNVTVTVTCAA